MLSVRSNERTPAKVQPAKLTDFGKSRHAKRLAPPDHFEAKKLESKHNVSFLHLDTAKGFFDNWPARSENRL